MEGILGMMTADQGGKRSLGNYDIVNPGDQRTSITHGPTESRIALFITEVPGLTGDRHQTRCYLAARLE